MNDAARSFGSPEVTLERFQSVWGQGIGADVRNLYPGRTHRDVEEAYERAMAKQADTIVVNPEAGLARFRFEDVLNVARDFSPEMRCISQFDLVVVDVQVDRLLGGTVDDDAIPARALQLSPKESAGFRLRDPAAEPCAHGPGGTR